MATSGINTGMTNDTPDCLDRKPSTKTFGGSRPLCTESSALFDSAVESGDSDHDIKGSGVCRQGPVEPDVALMSTEDGEDPFVAAIEQYKVRELEAKRKSFNATIGNARKVVKAEVYKRIARNTNTHEDAEALRDEFFLTRQSFNKMNRKNQIHIDFLASSPNRGRFQAFLDTLNDSFRHSQDRFMIRKTLFHHATTLRALAEESKKDFIRLVLRVHKVLSAEGTNFSPMEILPLLLILAHKETIIHIMPTNVLSALMQDILHEDLVAASAQTDKEEKDRFVQEILGISEPVSSPTLSLMMLDFCLTLRMRDIGPQLANHSILHTLVCAIITKTDLHDGEQRIRCNLATRSVLHILELACIHKGVIELLLKDKSDVEFRRAILAIAKANLCRNISECQERSHCTTNGRHNTNQAQPLTSSIFHPFHHADLVTGALRVYINTLSHGYEMPGFNSQAMDHHDAVKTLQELFGMQGRFCTYDERILFIASLTQSLDSFPTIPASLSTAMAKCLVDEWTAIEDELNAHSLPPAIVENDQKRLVLVQIPLDSRFRVAYFGVALATALCRPEKSIKQSLFRSFQSMFVNRVSHASGSLWLFGTKQLALMLGDLAELSEMLGILSSRFKARKEELLKALYDFDDFHNAVQTENGRFD